MTKDKLEALVKAGEALAAEAGSGISCDCDCVLCDRLRALVAAWRSALADLRASEQPAGLVELLGEAKGELRAELAAAKEEAANLRLALGPQPPAAVLSPLSVPDPLATIEAMVGGVVEAAHGAQPLICPACGMAWPELTPGDEDTVTCQCGRLLGCASRVR